MVGWIEAPSDDTSGESTDGEYQLVVLTFAGGWYRLRLPKLSGSKVSKHGFGNLSPSKANFGSPPKFPSIPHQARSISGSSATGRLDKGKEKERDAEKKESRNCTLEEFRRFGRWDGWG